MTPDHKRKAVQIYDDNGKMWNVLCIQTMQKELLVSLKEMTAIQIGVWHAVDDRTHLDRGMEDAEIITPPEVPGVVIDVEKTREKANKNVSVYELKPAGMSGTDLLDHAISFCLREYAKN